MKIVEYIPVFLLMLILPVYVVRSRCGGVMCAPKAEIPKIKWIKTPEIANPEDRETPEEAAPLPAEPEST
jgi:hypothetical protein